MAIRKKGNKWQVDVTYNGIRAPRVSCDTAEEAAKTEAVFRAQLMSGVTPVAPGSPAPSVTGTLGETYQAAVREHWTDTKSGDQQAAVAHTWVQVLYADFRVDLITPVLINKCVERFRELGNSAATVNRKLSALSVMLKTAKSLGFIEEVPRMPKQKEYVGRLRWFTQDEVDSLEDYFSFRDPDFRDLIVLAADTGFRLGELLKIVKTDYSAETDKLTAWVTKGNAARSVPLTMRASEIMRRRSQGCKPRETIWPNNFNSMSISRKMAEWRAKEELADDDEACFHTLRHTCCSRLVQGGVSLPVVQKWMGHAKIETTMRYAHLAPDAFEDALVALSKGIV